MKFTVGLSCEQGSSYKCPSSPYGARSSTSLSWSFHWSTMHEGWSSGLSVSSRRSWFAGCMWCTLPHRRPARDRPMWVPGSLAALGSVSTNTWPDATPPVVKVRCWLQLAVKPRLNRPVPHGLPSSYPIEFASY